MQISDPVRQPDLSPAARRVPDDELMLRIELKGSQACAA
jgi:hypothetical protein